MKNSQRPYVSIVIPSYNRSDLLQKILDAVAAQTLTEEKYEVIVVDNNSIDDTKQAVQSYSAKIKNLKYILETKQGACHARNRGIQEAKGEYTAFMDDDCIPPDHWLKLAISIIKEDDPVVFGGPYIPYQDKPLPKWYKVEYQQHKPFEEKRVLQGREYGNIFGGNMVCKSSVLKKITGWDPDFGPVGNDKSFSEDTKFVKSFNDYFPEEKAIFHPDLYVYHLVNVDELNINTLIKYSFKAGRCLYLVWDHDETNSKGTKKKSREIAVKLMILKVRDIVYDITFNAMRRDRKKYPYYRSYLAKETRNHIRKLGKLYQEYKSYK